MKSPSPYQSHRTSPTRLCLRSHYLSHLHINDLPDKTRSKMRLFVDDTAIYLAISSLEDAHILQQDLDHLHLWELDWDMEFNPSKCVVIHITRSRIPVPSQYLLHGQVLESVAGSKYLGVELSNNISFNSHIQNRTTSAGQSLGFIKRSIRSKNPELREMTYKKSRNDFTVFFNLNISIFIILIYLSC